MARKSKNSSKKRSLSEELELAKENTNDCANCKRLLGIIEILMDKIAEQEARIEKLEKDIKSEKSSKVFEEVESKEKKSAKAAGVLKKNKSEKVTGEIA